MRSNYIDDDAPQVKTPEYHGSYYEAYIPATFDPAEMAALSINALTETLDPEFDYELYWIADLLSKTPTMYHTIDDHVQAKFFQALPLLRTASGSRQNMEIERGQMQAYLDMQGKDGLIYIPLEGRPWGLPSSINPWAGLDFMPQGSHWCSLIMSGRILGAFCIYAMIDPKGPWKRAAYRLVEGIKSVTIIEGDIAYLYLNCHEPGREVVKPAKRPRGMRAGANGWVAQGLIQCYRIFGNIDALEIGEKMTRYIMRDSGYFGSNGEFNSDLQDLGDLIHFHSHTNQIMNTLELVQATGNNEMLGYALKAYEYAVKQGTPLIGFFPEFLTCKGYGEGPVTSETCCVADMIASALKLSMLGHDKWDDADRWARNQFAESQLTGTNWLTDSHIQLSDRRISPLPGVGGGTPEYGTTDRVLERTIGSFSGWPAANDFVQGRGWTIMHCCTGNASRTIYYLWENIITFSEDGLRVNLLMNRASKWADIDSHIPYSGRVDIRIKEDICLKVRIPGWVDPEYVTCMVNCRKIKVEMDGRYLEFGRVFDGDKIEVLFPIYERTEKVILEKQKYIITFRGNEVVAIDPPGINHPLYQRGHYRRGETLWKKKMRFVPDKEIKWC